MITGRVSPVKVLGTGHVSYLGCLWIQNIYMGTITCLGDGTQTKHKIHHCFKCILCTSSDDSFMHYF